jgi:hypothetical protein
LYKGRRNKENREGVKRLKVRRREKKKERYK